MIPGYDTRKAPRKTPVAVMRAGLLCTLFAVLTAGCGISSPPIMVEPLPPTYPPQLAATVAAQETVDAARVPPTPVPSGVAGAPAAVPTGATEYAYTIPDDLAYIDLMVPHHRLALDMANLAKEKAQHGEIKGMAYDIIREQGDEVRRLLLWRDKYYPNAPTPGPQAAAQVHSMPGMGVDLAALASSADFDRAFIDAMIPHHESAIEMSRAAMPNLKHQEIVDFAHDVTTVQQTEIDRMLLWRQQWFGK